jgi:trigger factor
MHITETNTDGLLREFKVVVDATEIEGRIVDRLEQLKRTVRMPGFRPGKVPMTLLRRKYGDSIRGEVLEQALSQTSSQALSEKGLRPAIQPKVEVIKFDEGDDLEYTMAVELMPDIVPGNFREISLTRQKVEVTDADVDAAVARLASHEKNYIPVTEDRAARKDDALVIDFVGSVDGVPFEGGSAKDHVLELGSNSFIEGFEDQLVGAKVGDHISVELTFPDKYMNDELAGKPATFEVDVKEIQKVEPVAIDDVFAQAHGFDDLAAFRAGLAEQIEREYSAHSRAKLKRALLDALSDEYDFAVPKGMVDMEFEAIWQRISTEMAQNKLDPSDMNRSEEDLRDEYRGIAERRVRLGLLFSEIGRLNNISVEQDEMNHAIMEQARTYPGRESAVMDFYRQNPEAVNELRAPLFEDKVVNFVLEMTNVGEEIVSLDVLMRDPDDETATEPDKKAKKASTKKSKPKSKAKKSK